MKKKSVSKIILKVSEGVVARAVDIALIGIFYFAETTPFTQRSLRANLSRVERDLQRVNYSTLKRALLTAQEKGWMSKNLDITSEGQKRLNTILPKYFGQRKWNGKWYIATYDIPENKRHLRNILRKKLEKLGFGQLQKSVWVSPYNFLGDIEKIIEKYNLARFVLLAISDKLGREPSRELAEKVWGLRELQDDYQKFVRVTADNKLSKSEIIFKYLAVLSRDPQLPQDLLPVDWKGKEAYEIYRKYSKRALIHF